MRIVKQILGVLATGYILMFYSEFVFWAHVRPGDSMSNWLYTWLAYSLLAFVFLTLIARFHIHTIWALFLTGTVFGWLAEGVIVQTAYESLPLSISWTGLAWHALISVWVGWYAVHKVLLFGLRPTVFLSAIIGLFYGFWAIAWWVEPEPDRALVSPIDFARFVIVTSLVLVLAYWIYNQLVPASFTPSRTPEVVATMLLLLYFIFVTVPATQIAIVILPTLFLGIYFALRHNQQVENRDSLLSSTSRSVRLWNYLGLLVLPLAAIGFYTAAFALGLEWHTNWVTYLVTTPLGFIMLGISLIRVWQMKSNG